MHARVALFAAALAATPLAHAADETIAGLARETGLSERNVRMVVGARSAFPEYRVVFDRVDRQFKQRVGEDRYGRLTGRATPRQTEAATAEVRTAGRKPSDPTRVAGL